MPNDVTDSPQAAVLIGRFQPFHAGHLALLRQALDAAAPAGTVVIVIGSAFQARTPKNPFTWTERAEMIRLAVPEAEHARLRFLPLRDHYDEARWVAAARAGVEHLLGAGAHGTQAPVLVGFRKDATSDYLRRFPGWQLAQPATPLPGADGTALRDMLFRSADPDLPDALAAGVDVLPDTTRRFLLAWSRLPFLPALREEWAMLQAYRQAWAAAPYAPMFITVDAVVQCAGHVLLVQRGQAPGRGLWAVPGGFLEARETLWQSALRELEEETHLHLLEDAMRRALREVAVFDHPDRSQRGRTVTHAHHFDLGDRELPDVRADDDAAAAQWVPIATLAAMEDRFFDDHFHMLDHFLHLTSD